MLTRMVEAGLDVARLNFSRGSAPEHEETIARIRSAANRAGRNVAVLQDLPGPCASRSRMAVRTGLSSHQGARRITAARLRRGSAKVGAPGWAPTSTFGGGGPSEDRPKEVGSP